MIHVSRLSLLVHNFDFFINLVINLKRRVSKLKILKQHFVMLVYLSQILSTRFSCQMF